MYTYWGAGERSARYSKKRKILRGPNRSENIGLPFVKTNEISGLAGRLYHGLRAHQYMGIIEQVEPLNVYGPPM